MMAMQPQLQQHCRPAQILTGGGCAQLSPCYLPAHHINKQKVQPSALSELAVLAQMIQGAPSTTAATQNAVQNTLQNAPLGLKETPERLIIVASLIAVSLGGYLVRERLQKK